MKGKATTEKPALRIPAALLKETLPTPLEGLTKAEKMEQKELLI